MGDAGGLSPNFLTTMVVTMVLFKQQLCGAIQLEIGVMVI